VSKEGRFLKTEGTVLKSRGFGEGHAIVTIFTGSHGKVDASAFGVRKTKSRFGSSLETFTVGSFLLYRSKPDNPYTVKEVDIISPGIALRENLSKYLIGSVIVETVFRFVDPAQPDHELHRLLTSALRILSGLPEQRVMSLLCMYELRFLDVMGYRTDPERCSKCGRELERDSPRFADQRFGFPLCETCSAYLPGGAASPVSGQAVSFVRWAAEHDLSWAEKVTMKQETRQSVRKIVECLYAAVFGRFPESWSQLVLVQA
jgi:DNA repair protein RecO (recombination protein O)